MTGLFLGIGEGEIPLLSVWNKGTVTSKTSSILSLLSPKSLHSYYLPSISRVIIHVSVVMEGTAVTSTWREGAPIIPPLLWWMIPGYDSRSRMEREATESEDEIEHKAER